MQLSFGWLDDIPDIAALARAELPSMTTLHNDEGWRTHIRFGRGEEIFSNCTLVLRDSDADNILVGFIWVDAAMYVDKRIVEPWWCINALAVNARYRRKGIGRGLVGEIEGIATATGVALLYGQSVAEAVPFWKAADYILAADGEAVRTHAPAMLVSGERVVFTAEPGPGDRFFLKYLARTPGSVRSGLLPVSVLNGG